MSELNFRACEWLFLFSERSFLFSKRIFILHKKAGFKIKNRPSSISSIIIYSILYALNEWAGNSTLAVNFSGA